MLMQHGRLRAGRIVSWGKEAKADLHDGVGNGQADIWILRCQDGAHLQGNTEGFTVPMSCLIMYQKMG